MNRIMQIHQQPLCLGVFAAVTLLGARLALADVRTNQDPPGLVQNNASLTINPALAGNVIMAYNDHPYPGICPGLGVSFSLDNGLTWTDRQLAFPPPMLSARNTMTAADTLGALYAGYVADDNIIGGQSGVFLHQSTDGGNTWLPATTVFMSTGPFNDKPDMVVDRSAASPYTDHVYVTWQLEPGGGPFADIVFASSTPGGTNFTAPVQISDAPTSVGMGNFPSIAVASDGTIYVAWIDTNVTAGGQVAGMILLDRSTDGGATWGTDVLVQPVLTVPQFLTDGQGGPDALAYTTPHIAVAPNDPQRVYLVYASDPDVAFAGDEADVFFTRSNDGGATWSAPMMLNTPPANQHQFQPRIIARDDGTPDGVVDVVWYDGGLIDAPDIIWAFMVTRSFDGGFTWFTPLPLSDRPFVTPMDPVGLEWLGDHPAVCFDGTYTYLGFTTSLADGSGDTFVDRLENQWLSGWFDMFDTYNLTNRLPDQSAWMPWNNEAIARNFYASTTISHFPPQSLEINGDDHAVYQFGPLGTYPRLVFKAWVYVPSAMANVQYIELLNSYPADPSTPESWSLQLELNGPAGLIRDFHNPSTNIAMQRDTWMEIRVEINHDADSQVVYCDGQYLLTKGWSDGVASGGAQDLAAVALWGAGSPTSVYFDDLSLVEVLIPPCPEDLTGDNVVDVFDLFVLLNAWGTSGPGAGLAAPSNVVDVFDLFVLLNGWGACP